jgi:hypothetical protein
MRAFMILMACAALLLGVVILRRATTSKPTANADDGEEIGALRKEVAALRGRVGVAEVLGQAALARPVSPAVIPPAPAPQATNSGASDTATNVAPSRLTQEQQVNNFRTYFEELDALRGRANDTALAAKVETSIGNFDWKVTDSAGPTRTSVTCGNGYCRVALTFKEPHDAEAGRIGLSMAAGAVLERMSVFLDPKTLQVEGYFASADEPFPPFPSAGAVARNEP